MNILKSYYHHYTIISKNIQYKYKIKIVCIIWKYSYKKAVISLGFVQNYTIRWFKINKSTCNEDKIVNEVDRKFKETLNKSTVEKANR